MDHITLSPELILNAYANGVFPMAESREDQQIFWVDPDDRGILPLDGFHISRSLAKDIRANKFTVTLNQDFHGVMSGCADRPETWINDTIFDLYCELHRLGFGHSVEVYQKDILVGGVYGLALGSAFFGESMFSRTTNASKVALAHLMTRLKHAGFTLCDTQFITSHLASLGGVEIPRDDYQAKLAKALNISVDLAVFGAKISAQDVLQANGQMS